MMRDRKDTAITFVLLGFLIGTIFGLAYSASDIDTNCNSGITVSVIE